MTPEQTKSCIEVMQAHVDGKTIEYRNKTDLRWLTLNNNAPQWNWTACEYRVRREPRVLYVNRYDRASPAQWGSAHETLAEAARWIADNGKTIKFVEVIEGDTK